VLKVDHETRRYSRSYKIRGSRLLNMRLEFAPNILLSSTYCEQINTCSYRVSEFNKAGSSVIKGQFKIELFDRWHAVSLEQ